MKRAGIVWMVFFVLGGVFVSECFAAERNTGAIQGKVVDAQTGASLSPARVALFQKSGQGIMASIATESDGTFDFRQVPFGEYRMAVSCSGYLDGEVALVEVTREDRVVLIGSIALVENVVVLDEVTVTRKKLKGVEEIDRTVFNVSDDIINASTSGLDLLRHIPSVTVDFLETVTLEGKTDIQFHVDGVQRSKEFVSQLAPEKIDRVELITSPSVKYDADISGIISIRLKKEQRDGFHGMVKVPISNPDKIMAEPAASLDYTVGDFRLFVGEKMYYRRWDADESVASRWTATDGASGRFAKEKTYSYKLLKSYLDYGVDWFIGDRTALNFLGEWRFWEYDPKDEVSQSHVYVDDQLSQYYTTVSDTERRNDNHYFSLFFRRELKQEGCDFTVEAYFNQEDYESDFDYRDIFYDTRDMSAIVDTLSGIQSTNDKRKTAQLKADYAFLTGPVKNEVGVKTFKGRAESDSFESGSGEGGQNNTDAYAYDEWRHRFYYNALGQWGWLKWQLGGSGEFEETDFDSAGEVDHFYFLPQVTLKRDIGVGGTLKLSYKRNVERPMTYQLRPFETITDPLHVSKGNPDLEAEKEDSFELSFSKNFGSNYISPKLYVDYIGNAIQDVTTLREDGVFETTRENAAEYLEYGIGLVASLQVTNFWRLNGYLSGFNREIKSGSDHDDYREKKTSYTIAATNIFTLPKEFSLALVSYYPSPSISYRTESHGDLFFLLDLNKKIFKRLDMNIVYFPFANYGSENIVAYPEFYEKSTKNIDTQGWFVISFKYTFDYGAETKKIDRDSEYEMVDEEGDL
jgi:hypothetical protein